MIFKQDYRKCVSLSLDIMKQQRERLFKDTLDHHSVIFSGLHEYRSKSTRELYFQEYIIEWMNDHWGSLNEYLKKYKKEMTINEQRDITLFFAEYFSVLLDDEDISHNMSCEVMHEMMKIKQAAISEMISYSDKWEEKNNKLNVDLKKNKEQFERMLTELTKDDNDG